MPLLSRITTQATFSESRQQGQRFVEIGPGNTLQAMLKKTLAQHQGNQHDQDLECLTFADELEVIQRASEADQPKIIPPSEHTTAPQELLPVPEPSEAPRGQHGPLPPPIVATTPPKPRTAAFLHADAPPTAAEAIDAIVSYGLRMPKGSVDRTQSIRLLAKGRSALQNEIVGNLDAEFGQLPDDVENIPIVDLGEKLQPTFSGGFGKHLNEWVAKQVSAKLAPAVTVSKVCAHLEKVYGLQTGRQSSFFLVANFDEIATRHGDENKSWQCLDRWALAYTQERGLAHPGDPSDQQNVPASGTMAREPLMDKSILTNFSRDLSTLLDRHFGTQGGDGGGSIGPAQSHGEQAHVDDSDAQPAAHLEQELGRTFIDGTRPLFKPELVHRYQSGWNWAVQDLYVTLSDLISRSDKLDQGDVTGRVALCQWIDEACNRLRGRATGRLRQCARYLLEKWERDATSMVRDDCMRLLSLVLEDDQGHLLSEHAGSNVRPTRRTAPRTTITEDGDIEYHEVAATEENAAGHGPSGSSLSSWEGIPMESDSTGDKTAYSTPVGHLQPVTVLTRVPGSVSWETDVGLTAELQQAERRLARHGDAGLYGTTLVIGAGRQSIGFALVRRLLRAGCRVAICTNRGTAAARREVAQLFTEEARPGAELVLLPFNQASTQDIDDVVKYINETLGWEIDHLVPFAAIPERGRTLQDLDSTSELAHRVMVINTLRLMGSVATSKQRRQVLHHSTQVLVPLSPNHGQFSNDGVYAESKLALEALLHKWGSEPWSEQLSVCAVRIGWTRGTGLMATNDLLAEEVENLGIRTFSTEEMATLLTLAMSPSVVEACTLQAIICDFSGGLQSNAELSGEAMEKMRASIHETSSIRKRLKQEADQDNLARASNKIRGERRETAKEVERRSVPRIPFPGLPEQREDAARGGGGDHLQGLFDLDSMVVITGFAELGPAGSSRTRWELEADGEFSLEGCVELAWMTGLIRYERHRVRSDGQEVGPGWVEAATGAPIREVDVKPIFEDRIRSHTGIRILEPEESAGANPDPRLRNMLHEVSTQEDLPPFECSPEAADALRARHGGGVEIMGGGDGMTVRVRVLRGSSIFVPKAINTDFFIGAQMPTGWDPARYGIPPDVIATADRPALYSLVCTVEAFLSAGVTDVYELYKYIHVSEVGNCLGSGAGGIPAIQRFHEQRLLGKEVRNDILSEAFVGTAAAWLNLLLLSASGPIKTGAGTCATSLESLDTACELIQSGRAKLCLAGGYDVFTHPVYYEFGAMTAMASAAGDERRGREPAEMSRPFSSTRGGFVLGEGVGAQVVCSASLALEMGLPVYGIVAMTHMAADQLGRSVPAPGRGMLTAARFSNMPALQGLVDQSWRARRVRKSLAQIETQAAEDEASTRAEALAAGCSPEEAEWRAQGVREAARLEEKAVRCALGQRYFVGHPGISPIAGALSVYGLGIDDLTFASLHGTATKLNDTNECATLDRQMRHLGRHAGNPLLTIAQKSVVGHGLGASGAWAVNGALQTLHSGLVPGNRNLADVDSALQGFDRLLLCSHNIAVRPEDMKAFTVTSFGFGQKGAQVVIVHPRHLYAAISNDDYRAYRAKQMARGPKVARELDRGLHGKPLFKAKVETPYGAASQETFLLDPMARV